MFTFMMKLAMFWHLLLIFPFYGFVFCGRNILKYELNEEQPHEFTYQKSVATEFSLNAEKLLHRNKRYLLWTNGGISKIVLGFLTPVETRDPVNWRTLNMAYNYQAQYVPIPNTTHLWQFFARDLRHQRRMYDENGIYFQDLTRQLIYGAFELFYNSRGKSGRKCLLKSICDAAEHPVARDGIFEEIVHLILTPNDEEAIDDDYKNARLAGEHGLNCTALYHCHFGDGFFDKFSYLA